MFAWIPFFLFIYTALRLIVPLPISLYAKAACVAALLVPALKQWVFVHFGGSYFSPELPAKLIVFYGAAFGVLFLMFALTFLRDVAMVVLAAVRLVRPSVPQIAHTVRTALIFTAAACAVSIYGTYMAESMPRVVEKTVAIPRLPREFEGFRVLLLSDIHVSASRRADYARKIAEQANDVSADLILITGDFIDGTVEARSADIAPLAALSAPYGVYGILGNHEYYFGARVWKDFIEQKLSIKILRNEHVMVERDGAQLAVAGVADAASLRFPGEEPPDPAKATSGIPAGTPIIILDHQPGRAAKNAATGADLQLSGHTHGGMVPGLTTVIKRFNSGYVRGWYNVRGMKLYVSPGTGIWNGFMLRIGVPAEMTVMRLTRGGGR